MEQVRRVSVALSAKQHEIGEAAERLLAERDALRARSEALGMRLFETLAQAQAGEAVRVVACDALAPSQARKAAGHLAEGARYGLVLIPREDGWSFALCSQAEDVRPAVKGLCAAFGGKGGGPKDMAQGVLVSGSEAEIREKLVELTA